MYPPKDTDSRNIYVVYTNKKDLDYEDVNLYYLDAKMGSENINTLFCHDFKVEERKNRSILKKAIDFFQGKEKSKLSISDEQYKYLQKIFSDKMIQNISDEDAEDLSSEKSVLNDSFSYAEDRTRITKMDTVKTEEFIYGEGSEKISYQCSETNGNLQDFLRNYQENIETRAKEEIEIDYDKIIMVFDAGEEIWRVGFFPEDYKKDCQYVYMSWDGITKEILTSNRRLKE